RKAIGPLLILVGLFMIGLFSWRKTGKMFKIPTKFKDSYLGSFLMGASFTLAFCPTIVKLYTISAKTTPICSHSSRVTTVRTRSNMLYFWHIIRGSFFMIISYDFGSELGEYASLGKGNDFPIFDRCPSCNCIAHGNLHRNGYYWRYGINEDVGLCLPICRWRCLACKVNISILPDFLIPYFQHTLHTIVERVRSYLEGKRDADNRQQLSQVIKRFYHRLHWIHSFFVDIGHQLGLTKDIK